MQAVLYLDRPSGKTDYLTVIFDDLRELYREIDQHRWAYYSSGKAGLEKILDWQCQAYPIHHKPVCRTTMIIWWTAYLDF